MLRVMRLAAVFILFAAIGVSIAVLAQRQATNIDRINAEQAKRTLVERELDQQQAVSDTLAAQLRALGEKPDVAPNSASIPLVVPGPMGVRGLTGPRGVRGATGRGLRGTNGATGADGDTITGPPGVPGVQGEPGPAGVGVDGAPGKDGANGADGQRGPAGPLCPEDATSQTVTVLTTTGPQDVIVCTVSAP